MVLAITRKGNQGTALTMVDPGVPWERACLAMTIWVICTDIPDSDYIVNNDYLPTTIISLHTDTYVVK